LCRLCANSSTGTLVQDDARPRREGDPAGGPRKLVAVPGIVKIVLVEDNQIFRETLELLLGLRGDLEIVGSVGTGQEAIDVCTKTQPNVAVVDYRMPGLSGAQTTEAILQASPATRVV